MMRNPDEKTMDINLINELLYYKDGELYWKKNNKKAGSKGKNGIHIRINTKLYLNHRVIFLMKHGYLPNRIDHKDGNPFNNQIENLREATTAQNAWNSKLSSRNKSGVKGVCWVYSRNKWQVRLMVNGVLKSFGYYFDKEVAKFVIETMRYKYHREFAR